MRKNSSGVTAMEVAMSPIKQISVASGRFSVEKTQTPWPDLLCSLRGNRFMSLIFQLFLLTTAMKKRKLMDGQRYALSAVFGPDGRIIGEPLVDEEGIVYADIDLNDLITPKLM